MKPVRILIVDDSAVLRQLLREIVQSDPRFVVAAESASGEDALARLDEAAPDAVTLDVEMPGLSGLEVLARLRRRRPRLPVVMFSHLTERGSRATLEALCLGASDYTPKPTPSEGLDAARAAIRTQLIPKLLALVKNGSSDASPVPLSPLAKPRHRPELLAIGASTGGPNALSQLLKGLGKNFPIPIVMVQHMPPMFTQWLAERLTRESNFNVREGEAGGALDPGLAWLAPGNRHLVVNLSGARPRVDVTEDRPENSCRPSVDVLFRSVAALGPRALGLVLTGMGQDGLKGAQALHDAGAPVWAQDQATSVIWGMPGAVARAGLAEEVLPLDQLAARVRVRLGLEEEERL